ncbi:MAG TPA: hypothetical protein VGD67_15685 [Pseudonocardiaceae bacterium]
MDEGLAEYLVFVTLGIGLTVVVGQLLLRGGRVYLEELLADARLAASVNTLLGVLFHLVVLGVLGVISTIEVPVDGTVQTVITKLGVVLLVLGLAHGVVMLGLARLRTRREERRLLAAFPS